MTRGRRALVLVAAAVGGYALPAVGQGVAGSAAAPRLNATPVDTALERRTTAIASQLRCVVCQGLSIQDSPSELAQQMRGVVKEQLAAGKGEAEVVDYFVSKYGEWVLLSPRPEGFNLVAYVLPVAFLVGGVIAVIVAVRRWSAPPAAEATIGDAGAGQPAAGDPPGSAGAS